MADQKRDRAAYYNKHVRDPEAVKFYNSKEWRGPNGARTQYIRQHPTCERCDKVVADHVHHKIPFSPGAASNLDLENLFSACISCHNIIEAEVTESAVVTAKANTITIVEDEEYYFDEQATPSPANRPLHISTPFSDRTFY